MKVFEFPTTPMPGDAVQFVGARRRSASCYDVLGVLKGTIGIAQQKYSVALQQTAESENDLACCTAFTDAKITVGITISGISISDLVFTGVSCPVPSWWWNNVINARECCMLKDTVPLWSWHGRIC